MAQAWFRLSGIQAAVIGAFAGTHVSGVAAVARQSQVSRTFDPAFDLHLQQSGRRPVLRHGAQPAAVSTKMGAPEYRAARFLSARAGCDHLWGGWGCVQRG